MTENTPQSLYSSIRMEKKDWQILSLSLFPAALMAFGDMIHSEAWLRIYTPLFHLTILLLAAFSAGKRRPGKATAFLLLCDAALIGLGFIRHDLFLCCANCFVIPMLTALAMLSACGVNRHSPLSAAGVWEAFVRSLRGLFDFIPLPFARLFKRSENPSKNLAIVVISLCVCFWILLMVLALLVTADAVFSEWCGALLESVDSMRSSPSAFRILLMIGAALMIFSWMLTLRRPARETGALNLPTIPSIFPSMLLPMLNLVYALFVYIQFSNLFGGAETAAMTGGYAEYARTGFFQLVTVAAVNLGVLAVSLRSKRSGWICGMSALLIGFTGVILFSAFWRMRLYIAAYGLSVLRVMTLWGMLAIAVLLVVSALSLIRRSLPAFTVGLICILILWVGINAVDIDRIIAEYNVFHYLSGELEQIDVDYLRTLSPSAQVVLERLEP